MLDVAVGADVYPALVRAELHFLDIARHLAAVLVGIIPVAPKLPAYQHHAYRNDYGVLCRPRAAQRHQYAQRREQH